MTEPMQFKEGDIVFLNSGSPLLTVEIVGSGDDELVCVVWMVEGLVQRDRFHRSALISYASYADAVKQNQLMAHGNYKAGGIKWDA